MTAEILKALQEGLGRDMRAFLPELVLCGAIVFLLIVRLFPRFDRRHLGWIALVLTIYAFILAWEQRTTDNKQNLFAGMLIFDNFSVFLKLFLLSFTILVIVLTLFTGIPDREDSADFFCLLLGAVIGMSVMAQANHLLMVFMGVEMASLPSYALAGFLKGKRQSSEAALKYVVYGGGASGVMLYGISLLAGKFGTGYLPDVVAFMGQAPLDPLIVLGTLFLLIGIGFKLAAVPFHFWCPDVFEGASAEVAAFLSVASKGAALALLARITLGLGGFTAPGIETDSVVWTKATTFLVPILAFFAVLTMTFGNLAAYAQTNLKRLLAYSTIAHAGFMMMGLACMTREGAGAVLFYLIIYLFMNLGAFAVVAYLRNLTGSEDLSNFRGLVHRSPLLVVTLGIFLLSLLGIPPLGGFAAKFQIFQELFRAAQLYTSMGQDGSAYTLYALVVIGGLNTVLSLFYYVKVLKVMVLDQSLEEVEGRPVKPLLVPALPGAFVLGLAGVVLALGIFWDTLSAFSNKVGISGFNATPGPARVAERGDG